jgi:hypothetical protein
VFDGVMSNVYGTGSAQYTAADDSGIVGIVSAVTYLDGNTSKNVSSVTIKTDANNSTIPGSGTNVGAFANGCLIWANANARNDAYGTGSTRAYSNTKMVVNIANSYVSNVVVVTAGSGYTQNPTVNIATISGTGSINSAVQCTGEERNSGGPIAAKYISRRVSLKDGFDASDLKIVLNAYKPSLRETLREIYFAAIGPPLFLSSPVHCTAELIDPVPLMVAMLTVGF